MSVLAGVLAAAALFALFGMLRPKRSCASGCASCSSGCYLKESTDEEA